MPTLERLADVTIDWVEPDLIVEDLPRVCRLRSPEVPLGLVARRVLLRSFAQAFLNSPARLTRKRSKVFAAVVS